MRLGRFLTDVGPIEIAEPSKSHTNSVPWAIREIDIGTLIHTDTHTRNWCVYINEWLKRERAGNEQTIIVFHFVWLCNASAK